MALDAEPAATHATPLVRFRDTLATAGTLAGQFLAPVLAWWRRTAISRYISGTLLRRILVSNLLGLAVLLGGVLYLSATHGWLLEAKRQSLQKQGQIIASAIGENAKIDLFATGDGDSTGELASRTPFRDDGFAALELSLSPERVTPILNRIIKPTDARARIYDRGLNLVVDTATLLQKG